MMPLRDVHVRVEAEALGQEPPDPPHLKRLCLLWFCFSPQSTGVIIAGLSLLLSSDWTRTPVRETSRSSTRHRSSPGRTPPLVRPPQGPRRRTRPIRTDCALCPQLLWPRRPPRPLEPLLCCLPPLSRRSDSERHLYTVADYVYCDGSVTMETEPCLQSFSNQSKSKPLVSLPCSASMDST